MIKAAATEQLTLLSASTTNPRFALSRSTRERGLRHVAEIRQQLAKSNPTDSDGIVRSLPPRHDQAA